MIKYYWLIVDNLEKLKSVASAYHTFNGLIWKWNKGIWFKFKTQDRYLAHRIQQPISKLQFRIFAKFLDQSEQVLQVLFFMFVFRHIQPDWFKKIKSGFLLSELVFGFLLSELVFGSGEQNKAKFAQVKVFFHEILLIKITSKKKK